ncbi:hydrogenase maturation nickel metallochaperone HypA [Mucilaginibacter paludis]|uniref:Hydrogenase maturation factor HypA n=1 Tax=Mucilaginibacter paludis DSM 18603 TaxID=714943 RepID=H1Y5H0_9SPHI|nr:hydrogenase maturation nickel metallochaperone HypA [Mucilaginibacter paludis]EHQ29322.1 hydrogenase expression/synthesis HypA [Mucilaginibacter paludis DSM 18603]
MHELSIVMSIIQIAEQQAATANAAIIEEIELDIGTLSGIEMNAFEFAWQQAVKYTQLQYAVKNINRITGKAMCLDCDTEFAIERYDDACPFCGAHLLNIIQGKELRVKSLLVS